METQLTDQVFIIGGGSAGLGYATAKALTDEGARVLIAGRDRERLDTAIASLPAGSAHGIRADVGNPDAAGQLVAAAIDRFGRLDGALVNTGGPRLASVDELTEQDWQDAVQAVLLGPIRLARETVQHLVGPDGSGGSLLFVLSATVRNPIPQLALSNALRPALAGHLKDIADAYGAGPKAVRANGILPYQISTSRGLSSGSASDTALGRFGTPDEFGSVAAFLLSPASSFVTGSLVAVDGGKLRSM